MKDLKKLLSLLFDLEDEIVVSNSKYSYHSIPQSSLLSGEVTLVSQNPTVESQIVEIDELVSICINPVKGFRKDENVTKYRTFLIEMDTGSLQSQYNYIKTLGMPYSACIFSGNKSLHFLITLKNPIKEEKAYRTIYQWILNVITLADQGVKNPSRCTRIPDTIRPETNKKQKLLEIKERINENDLETWLEKHPNSKPQVRIRKALTIRGDFDKLSPWVQRSLMNSYIDFSKGRNSSWYAVFYDFALAGYSLEEAVERLDGLFREDSDFKEKEWLTTAKSAYNHALKSK